MAEQADNFDKEKEELLQQQQHQAAQADNRYELLAEENKQLRDGGGSGGGGGVGIPKYFENVREPKRQLEDHDLLQTVMEVIGASDLAMCLQMVWQGAVLLQPFHNSDNDPKGELKIPKNCALKQTVVVYKVTASQGLRRLAVYNNNDFFDAASSKTSIDLKASELQIEVLSFTTAHWDPHLISWCSGAATN